jgi:type I restriction enzyme S subunit
MDMINKFPNGWSSKTFDELFDYIQPTKYIVESTDYDEKFKTPVLTAGKSFIIGYTNETSGIFSNIPVIIFDDFTTATKFVNFPFKVKSSAMKILSPKNQHTNIKFAFYYMQTLNISTDTHKRYWISEYSKIKIPFPPPSEQDSIVSKIEELLSDLENGKQQLLYAQQQLKIYRQSLLKWAFEGRLTNENVKEGELPEGWIWKKLNSIATKITDGEHITPKRTNSGYLLLSARNVQNGYLDLKNVDHIPHEEYVRIIKRCNPEYQDILISCSGSIGRVCRVPLNIEFTLVRSVALVKMDWRKYSSKFYEYLFQSPILQIQIEKSKKATAQANLFLGPINDLDVIICPLVEQQRIVDELESRLTVCDKIEETITQSLQQAETLKQSILKMAFEGRLVTNHEGV